MFYTQRRANQHVEFVSDCYGSAIGVAQSADGANWFYRGTLDLDFEFGHNTFWAPEIVYNPADGLYHMFVTYIQGCYIDWGGKRTIEHYTSQDLFYWTHVGSLEFDSGRIIDPCLYQLPDGKWRMWYKDEDKNACTCYADSPDLYTWEYRGIATDDCMQEGPNVFALGGKYWLITDVWAGLNVYHSDDLEHFTLQEERILREPGTRRFDDRNGDHADVYIAKGRAYIIYFTMPNPDNSNPHACIVQMAELKVVDGKLVCDRDADFDVDWI